MERAQHEYVSVAAAVTEVEQIAPAYRAAFKRVVEEALQRIFQTKPDDALKLVATYFHQDGGPSLFTYQRSPMQIAADLSGAASRELTADEKDGYKKFLERDKDVFGLPSRSAPVNAKASGLQVRAAWFPG